MLWARGIGVDPAVLAPNVAALLEGPLAHQGRHDLAQRVHEALDTSTPQAPVDRRYERLEHTGDIQAGVPVKPLAGRSETDLNGSTRSLLRRLTDES